MARRRKRKRPVPGVLGWACLLLFALLTFLAALWVLRPVKVPPRRVKRPPLKIERMERRAVGTPRKRPSPPAASEGGKPLATIIIDDMGQKPFLERKFFSLKVPLNFAFLPYAPFTKELAREAHQRGFEVLVHIPLDAGNGERVPGLISLKMGKEEVKTRVREAILAVPFAVGANHHEGSKFTEDMVHTRWLLEEIAALDFFYVDSRTTPRTVVPKVALKLGLPFAERRVFLDHKPEEAEIKKALERFIHLAEKEGGAVAIGHPRAVTLRVLQAERGRLQEKLRLVPASVFIERTWRRP